MDGDAVITLSQHSAALTNCAHLGQTIQTTLITPHSTLHTPHGGWMKTAKCDHCTQSRSRSVLESEVRQTCIDLSSGGSSPHNKFE